MTIRTRILVAGTPEALTLRPIRVKTLRGSRQLTKNENDALVQMLAVPTKPERFDVHSLMPKGSYLERVGRHFRETDISYSICIMQLISVAASWLTQNGTVLEVPGVGRILPTLWTVGLAQSGSSKTMASDEIDQVLALSEQSISRLPTGATAAQWIVDLHRNNGAFWFQDEVGKFFNSVLTQSHYMNLKAWLLSAYSHAPIANRLKSEKEKLEIEKPAFTFHGLSVTETWKSDIDITSMLDGFCQRFNYYIASPRRDTDIFEHFLYFEGPEVPRRREALAEIWSALCAQPAASGAYTMGPDVLPFLRKWWSGLRDTWGQSPLPRSFILRIGFTVLRYLVVLHFLLGKSRHPIDVETAELATRYAEYHFKSALYIVQEYDKGHTTKVQKVAAIVKKVESDGQEPTGRNVQRRMSGKVRAEYEKGEIAEIVSILQQITEMPDLFDKSSAPGERTAALYAERDRIHERLKLNERKRNERRLRELLRAYRSQETLPQVVEDAVTDDQENVIQLYLPCANTG